MDPSNLDRRITIQQQSVSTDADNQTVETWAEWARPWAQYIPQAGSEAMDGGQIVAAARARFVTRYRAGVDESMRILHDGKMYSILSVIEVGRRDGLDILAEVVRGA